MSRSRLTSLKPLATIGPRLGFASGDEKAGDKHRTQAAPWRTWYHTAKWEALRQRVFLRDNYTCQKTGVLLGGRYPAPDSPVADHIKPHRGDPALFWDESNIETVSKAYHDREKQRAERSHRD